MSDRKKPSSRPPPAANPRVVVPADDNKPRQHPIGTPRGLSSKSGTLAVAAWLAERGIPPAEGKPWRIDISLGIAAYPLSRVFAESIDTRFQITILPDQWGYYFAHGGRVSRVRVTGSPQADGRDDYNLASATPALKSIGTLVRQLEQRFDIFLQRPHALIETTLPGAEPIVRAWLTTL